MLLLAASCMALALMLSGPAWAQSAEGNPCGGFVPGSPEAQQCYEDLGVSTVAPGSSASASASADPCPDPDFPRYTPDGCQASDLPDVDATASASATASATAAPESDDAGSASATAAAGSSASALPETGGPAVPAAASVLPLALLVVGGLFAMRLTRR